MLKVSLLAVIFALLPGKLPAQSAPALPSGAMQTKARTECTICHDSYIMVQQRLSKVAWGKEVDKMIKWGAMVDASDRNALVEYLSVNFPADKPAYIAARLPAGKPPR
jgi:hypothetical protein